MELSINIDHIATLRQARGELYPNPERAMEILAKNNIASVVMHLREDRRHIQDEDVQKLCQSAILPINLEIAPTHDMLDIAKRYQPAQCCFVPENRQELTTEGGLDIVHANRLLPSFIPILHRHNIKVCVFLEADCNQIYHAWKMGVDCIELHTGKYCKCILTGHYEQAQKEKERLIASAKYAKKLQLQVYIGHGLTYDTITELAKIDLFDGASIGHFLISESIFLGLEAAIQKMHTVISNAKMHHP